VGSTQRSWSRRRWAGEGSTIGACRRFANARRVALIVVAGITWLIALAAQHL
jgi:hypothetical protein